MQQLGFIVFNLAVFFVIPYVLGSLFFKQLKKKWKWLGGSGKGRRFFGYLVFLLCALVGWFLEYLVLIGVKMML
jgi:hypothetical protein